MLRLGCTGDARGSTRTALTESRFSLTAPTEIVKQIIINIEAGVEVEVTIAT
jgi:hypothetical protein